MKKLNADGSTLFYLQSLHANLSFLPSFLSDKMSFVTISFELPFGYTPDELLMADKSTSAERAFVLDAGVLALRALKDKSSSVSNTEAYDKAQKEAAKKWLADEALLKAEQNAQLQAAQVRARQEADLKRAETDADIRRLSGEIKLLQQKENIAAQARAEAEKQAQIARAEAAAVQQSIAEAKARVRAEADEEQARVKSTAAADVAAAKAQAAAEVGAAKAQAEAAAASKEAAVEKVRQELEAKLTVKEQQLQMVLVRQAGSATKGADNERVVIELLRQAFGATNGYELKDHKIESGDAIIQLDGVGLVMFEMKKYTNTVNSGQVKKAIDHLIKHREIAALIFIAEDVEISGHQRAGHFDISIEDGRPVIWVGKFACTENKVNTLQMIGQTLRALARYQKQSSNTAEDEILDVKEKLKMVRRYFNDTNEDLHQLDIKRKECKRDIDRAWNKFSTEITGVISRYGERLQNALYEEEPCAAPIVQYQPAPPLSLERSCEEIKTKTSSTAVEGKGCCSVCRSPYKLNKDGTIRGHKNGITACSGVGLAPV